MEPIILNKKQQKGRCHNVECGKKCQGKLCPTCRCRKSRAADPIRYAFNNKKNRARQKGIFWDLTLEQFTAFCYKTEYHLKKGKGVGSFDIDRKVEGKKPGYTISNIQVLEKTKNIKKYWRYWSKKAEREAQEEVVAQDDDMPFPVKQKT